MNFFRKKNSPKSKQQNSDAQRQNSNDLNDSVHRTKRILVMGSARHNGVISTKWDAAAYPNVADFDTIIIHAASLSPELEKAKNETIQIGEILPSSKWMKLSKNLDKLANDLLKLLDSGGTIYVVATSIQRFDIGWGSLNSKQQTNYEWLPFHFEITDEEGETREVVSDDFQGYFTNIKKWKLLFSPPQSDRLERWLAEQYGKNRLASLDFEPIAINRYGRQIASNISYRIFKATYPHEMFPEWRQPTPIAGELVKTSGQMIFLPAFDTGSDYDSVNWILENILYLPQKTLPPDWTEQIDVPGLSTINTAIAEKELTLRSLQAEIQELQKQKLEVAELRGLLFESGTRLEDLCKQTLSQLGASILPAQIAEEDFVLEFDGEQAIVEVKGNTKSISLSDMSQLGRYREDYSLKHGVEIKGVLLANPW